MKVLHPLFSQVALVQDLPEHNLKRGDIATIVEYYPMPEGEEDGYSLEGFERDELNSLNTNEPST